MDYQKRTAQESQYGVFTPPIDLSAGKLDAKAAAQGYALAAGLFTASFVLLMFGVWGIQMLTIDGIVGGVFASVMAYLAARSGYQVWSSVDMGYRQYDDYLADVRNMWLDAAESLQGQPTWSSHVEEEGFSITLPYVMTMAIAIAWERHHGAGRRLWTVDALTGKQTVTVPNGSGERYIHIGRISAPMAEQLGKTFSMLGLVEGRRERAAGEWTADTANEVVYKIFTNWPRLQQMP